MRALFLILRTLWTLPTTLPGLLLAIALTPFGARWQRRRGTLECYGPPLLFLCRRVPLPPDGILAITFGDIILGRSPAALDLVRDHEQVHVHQAHCWGPLFLPAYLLVSGYLYLAGRPAYADNPFEVQAREMTKPRP